MDKPLKALIISYYWPPSGGSGVQRWMYFARYLGSFGIEPVVVTVDEQYASYKTTDASLLQKIASVEVHKTKTLEPLRFYSFLKSGHAQQEIPQGNVGGKKKSPLDQLATYVRGNFFIPDARVGWNRYAYRKAAELLAQESFDVVITTGPPHSTHLVGLALKQKFQLPWIADFRDPWTELYYNSLFKRTARSQRKDKQLELSVLQQSDLVLTIGPSMQELLSSKIPAQKDKVHFIYNGYDAELMSEIVPVKKTRFTLAHIGILSEKQSYQSLAAAIKLVLEQHPEFEIDLILAGDVSENIVSTFHQIPGLQTRYLGKLTHREALQLMFDVHLLTNCLALIAESRILISGKLMEYLATGNPILAIGDTGGDAANLLTDIPDAHMFEPEAIQQMAAFIAAIYQQHEHPLSKPEMLPYSRLETARKLSGLIRGLVSKS
jgi:glycosyltransferase involved in cell wall biosynthesis